MYTLTVQWRDKIHNDVIKNVVRTITTLCDTEIGTLIQVLHKLAGENSIEGYVNYTNPEKTHYVPNSYGTIRY